MYEVPRAGTRGSHKTNGELALKSKVWSVFSPKNRFLCLKWRNDAEKEILQ